MQEVHMTGIQGVGLGPLSSCSPRARAGHTLVVMMTSFSWQPWQAPGMAWFTCCPVSPWGWRGVWCGGHCEVPSPRSSCFWTEGHGLSISPMSTGYMLTLPGCVHSGSQCPTLGPYCPCLCQMGFLLNDLSRTPSLPSQTSSLLCSPQPLIPQLWPAVLLCRGF